MRCFLAVLYLLIASVAHALSPADAVTFSLVNLDSLAVEDQPFQRYLFNPDEAEYLSTFTLAQKLSVNLNSTEPELRYPRLVVPSLWRLDLRDYGWDKRLEVWEKLALIDPYFHRRDTKDILVETIIEKKVPYEQEYGTYDSYGNYTKAYTRTEYKIVKEVKKERKRKSKLFIYAPQTAGQLASLALLTQSDAPIVRADWLLVQQATQISLNNQTTGAGYYDWLGLKNRDDYFKLIGLDAVRAARNELRAVVSKSGVAQNNRQITVDGAETGDHWTTLEVFDQSGRGVAINNLRRGEFLHVAEEHYAPLPNGLPATYLSDDKGVQQDSVPDKIAGNRSKLNTSNNLRVLSNISCMQCHLGAVLQPFEDDIRKQITGRLKTNTDIFEVDAELRRAYKGPIYRRLQRSQQNFQDVLMQVTGKTPVEAATLYSDAFTRYAYQDVTLAVAARELGVPELAFRKALRDGAVRLGSNDFRLGPFLLDTPGTISRLTWEDSFILAQDILYGTLVTP